MRRRRDNPWLAGSMPRGADYDRRFEALAESGRDVHGEAGLVAGLSPGSVLDAGCGTGRVALELARRGIDVVGVDLDPEMLAVARAKGPDLAWEQADLAELRLERQFDVVVAAGNVMIFLTPGSEAAVLRRLAEHLVAGGVLVAGFSLAPGGLDLVTYDELAAAAGMELVERLATWDGDPYTGGDYAVSIHRRAR